MIEIDKVTRFYGRQSVPALDKVSLTIPDGSLFGLLGPNGAGKTTLISILVGLLPPSSGSIRYDGLPLTGNLARVRASTGFVPQELAFYPMLSVAENLRFYAAAYGVPKTERESRIEQAVSTAKLGEHIHKAAHALSGGLKRRLNLAIGLLNAPRILFLDEPTVGIDPQSRNFILDTLVELNHNSNMTLVYTSHYMEEVQQICDRIAIIDHGRILLQGELQPLLDNMARTRMEFSLGEESARTLAGELRDQFGAHPVTATDFVIEAEDIETMLGPLSRFVEARGELLHALRFGYGSLESLYLHHTAAELRE